MKTFGWTAATTALAMAAALAGTSAVSAKKDAAPPASAFTPIERFAISYDSPRDMAEFYLRDFGIRPRDADFDESRDPADPNIKVMLVTVNGIADDSVKGIQMRLGLRASQGGWETIEAGVRRKCRRGDEAGNWTKSVCP
ncbi:MAG: hypothetical protein AAF251_05370 [Pseudomonadota bacterium]